MERWGGEGADGLAGTSTQGQPRCPLCFLLSSWGLGASCTIVTYRDMWAVQRDTVQVLVIYLVSNWALAPNMGRTDGQDLQTPAAQRQSPRPHIGACLLPIISHNEPRAAALSLDML